MTKIESIKDILNSETERSNIEVKGWVKTKRDSKTFSFIEVNDGSCRKNIQVVADENIATYENVKNITLGTSVCIKGDLIPSLGKEQKWEVKAKDVTIFGPCDPEAYPIQKKKTSDEFLRTVAHLRPRTNKYAAMLRIRSELSFAINTFFHNEGFFYVHTPLLTAADCEGGEMFQVTTLDMENPPKNDKGKINYSQDFFGKKSFLTGSGQLQGEALAMALGKIYTFGPTFRAENSNTYRHAAEFWMIEPEMAFYDVFDNMDLEEKFLKYIVNHVIEKCPEDLELFAKFVEPKLMENLKNITDNTFERITYTDALKILEKHNDKFDVKVQWGTDFNSDHERFLVEQHFKKPVILYDFPKEIKSYYMKQNDDGKTVRGTDVLVPRIGEIMGGSEREWDLDKLQRRIKEVGLSAEEYSWFLDLRRFGTVPHAGFGLGFERAMMLVTGIANIRDVTAFPRVPGYCEF